MATSRSKLVHRHFGEGIVPQIATAFKINQLKIQQQFFFSFAQISKHKITHFMGKRLITIENSKQTLQQIRIKMSVCLIYRLANQPIDTRDR